MVVQDLPAELSSTSSSSSSDEEFVAKMEFGEEEETTTLKRAEIDNEENESLSDDEDSVMSQAMLAGQDCIPHLSGEGVRQRFTRTKVIPNLEGHRDDDLDEFSSTASLLDSLLSSIDLHSLSWRVDFPELGRDLVHLPGEAWDPVTMMKVGSATWGDNWLVQGVDKFEEQEAISEERPKRIIPEVVPFLVPWASGDISATIGEKETDQVSELSEQETVGSIAFSTSDSSQPEDDTIQVLWYKLPAVHGVSGVPGGGEV